VDAAERDSLHSRSKRRREPDAIPALARAHRLGQCREAASCDQRSPIRDEPMRSERADRARGRDEWEDGAVIDAAKNSPRARRRARTAHGQAQTGANDCDHREQGQTGHRGVMHANRAAKAGGLPQSKRCSPARDPRLAVAGDNALMWQRCSFSASPLNSSGPALVRPHIHKCNRRTNLVDLPQLLDLHAISGDCGHR
jgi:hypothetical protein